MADTLISTAGLAVGGALVAAAVGFSAVKVMNNSKTSTETKASTLKKKKTKSKGTKSKAKVTEDALKTTTEKTISTESLEILKPKKEIKQSPEINLEDFVSNAPDTSDEEAARAERKKAKRKMKKKTKSKNSTSDISKEESAAAARQAALQDEADGWSTVLKKSKSKVKAN